MTYDDDEWSVMIEDLLSRVVRLRTLHKALRDRTASFRLVDGDGPPHAIDDYLCRALAAAVDRYRADTHDQLQAAYCMQPKGDRP